MTQKRFILGLGLVAVLAVIITVGINLMQGNLGSTISNNQNIPTGTVATVNGASISQDTLEQEYTALLNSYRPIYEENGNSFEDLISGADGAYTRLQLQFQALDRIIAKTIAEQKLEDAGLMPSDDDIEQEYRREYNEFLSELNVEGLDLAVFEASLKEVFQDPVRLPVAQDLLGFTENSLEALQARLRLEAESRLRVNNLWSIAFGDSVAFDPSDEAALGQLNDWLIEQKDTTEIVYLEPLMAAYSVEAQIASLEDLEDRSNMLRLAIGEYEKIANEGLSDDPNIQLYLNRLYNLKVNWDLQLERDLIEEAQSNLDAQKELEEIQNEIQLNRRKVAQSISPVDSTNEDLLRFRLQTDNNNPLYYYLLARVLLENWREEGIRESLNLIWAALQRDKEFVDAHVLMGDLNMIREFYIEAINDYQTAFDLYDGIVADQETAHKAKDSTKELIKRKLSEALVGRANQLDTMNEPPADAAAQRASVIDRADEMLQDLRATVNDDDTEYAPILTASGDLEILRSDFDQAEVFYRQSLELVQDLEVYVKLGNVLIQNDKLDEAVVVFETVLDSDPFFAEAHLGLARVYRAQGDLENALLKYEDAFIYGINLDYLDRRQIALDALELDPNNSTMRTHLGDYYLEMHVYTGALNQYDAILEHDDSHIRARIGSGQVHLERLQYEPAISAFREAEVLQPPLEDEIVIYELLRQAEKGLAGPGQPMFESGQEVTYKLAILYLRAGRLVDSFNMIDELTSKYLSFRTDEVAEFRRQLTQTVGDSLPGTPVADLGYEIINPGENHSGYNSAPPTSGASYAIAAAWGIHEEQIQDEIQLRNLAGGGILLQYNANISNEDLLALGALVQRMRSNSQQYCQVLMAPYESASSPIVLTAWNRMDAMDTFEEGRAISFIDTFINRGPATGEISCALDQ